MTSSPQPTRILRANPDFTWPGGKKICLVFNIAFEGWSDGEAPGIGPMGNVLKPGYFDANADSWAKYGPTRGVQRLDRIARANGVTTSIMVNGVLRVDCPTEHFKDSIRRVIVDFNETPPAPGSIPGLVSSRTIRNQLELIIVGYGDEHRKAIESLSPRSMDVIELNLEDAFIEYTRGPRRSLPSFNTEPVHA